MSDKVLALLSAWCEINVIICMWFSTEGTRRGEKQEGKEGKWNEKGRDGEERRSNMEGKGSGKYEASFTLEINFEILHWK